MIGSNFALSVLEGGRYRRRHHMYAATTDSQKALWDQRVILAFFIEYPWKVVRIIVCLSLLMQQEFCLLPVNVAKTEI